MSDSFRLLSEVVINVDLIVELLNSSSQAVIILRNEQLSGTIL